ncbi:hypothetical protein [Anaerorudis cellulosivorans]
MAENGIRPPVLGQKNYPFCGNHNLRCFFLALSLP